MSSFDMLYAAGGVVCVAVVYALVSLSFYKDSRLGYIYDFVSGAKFGFHFAMNVLFACGVVVYMGSLLFWENPASQYVVTFSTYLMWVPFLVIVIWTGISNRDKLTIKNLKAAWKDRHNWKTWLAPSIARTAYNMSPETKPSLQKMVAESPHDALGIVMQVVSEKPVVLDMYIWDLVMLIATNSDILGIEKFFKAIAVAAKRPSLGKFADQTTLLAQEVLTKEFAELRSELFLTNRDLITEKQLHSAGLSQLGKVTEAYDKLEKEVAELRKAPELAQSEKTENKVTPNEEIQLVLEDAPQTPFEELATAVALPADMPGPDAEPAQQSEAPKQLTVKEQIALALRNFKRSLKVKKPSAKAKAYKPARHATSKKRRPQKIAKKAAAKKIVNKKAAGKKKKK